MKRYIMYHNNINSHLDSIAQLCLNLGKSSFPVRIVQMQLVLARAPSDNFEVDDTALLYIETSIETNAQK
jgi:hypothetical protein